MKLLFFALFGAFCLNFASATTVIADGGLIGYQFGFTTATGGDLTLFTGTGESSATIAVGTIEDDVFSVFAPSDVTPPTFGDSGLLVGRWSGSAGDNSSDADAFNNLQIWFSVTTTIGGQTYTGYFADLGVLFPVNDGGFADDAAVLSNDLDAVSPLSTGTWVIDSVNQQVRLVIPEPSAALMGAFGLLGLLRRKR
jgi:hypothetical protein